MSKIKQIIKQAKAKKVTISSAESFTGGMIADFFVSENGSSDVFFAGLVLNCNRAKSIFLKIDPNEIRGEKVYSKKTAIKMAENALRITKTQICISTTGVAGDFDVSDKNPAGSFYIGISIKNKNSKAYHFKREGDRNTVRKKASEIALNLILQELENY